MRREIGQKVGAAEVILVGVSELGDVILTMQRIDVTARSVSARIADSLASGAQPTAPQLDGYLARLLPPSDFLRFGVIDIIATETGANVTIGASPPVSRRSSRCGCTRRRRTTSASRSPASSLLHPGAAAA